MKKAYLFLFTLLMVATMQSNAQQQYAGYRSSDRMGVNGVFFNPAYIAGNRFKWDVNVFSINAGVGNNNNKFALKGIGSIIKNADSLLYTSTGNNRLNALANVDFLGPSAMMQLDEKSAVAITTRVRAVVNVLDYDSRLINSIRQQVSFSTFPYSISSSNNQGTRINAWTEIGASYARVFSGDPAHTFKLGLTLKYLRGTGSAYVNINSLRATLDRDGSGTYVTDATGSIATSSAVDFENLKFNELLRSTGSGIGGDLGLIYEFRPNGYNSIDAQNGYKLKLGLAVLDVGGITYKNDPQYYSNYAMNIPAGDKLYLEQFSEKNIDEVKQILDADVRFTKIAGGNNRIALPTTLLADADYHISQNIYTNLAVQLGLSAKDKIQNPYYYGNVTLTPRFENKTFGVYVPLNYNPLTHFNAGLSLRAGPFFIGSGSFFTLAAGQSKQMDFHMGVRFGELQ